MAAGMSGTGQRVVTSTVTGACSGTGEVKKRWGPVRSNNKDLLYIHTLGTASAHDNHMTITTIFDHDLSLLIINQLSFKKTVLNVVTLYIHLRLSN